MNRPNPDQLLESIKQQGERSGRGKLKVFFGAAAGVGKTFAMLEEGRARAAEGLDVVVGYAEAHARPETEAVLIGLEILPYKIVEYKGAKLKELDIDAVLLRRPALVLVDELAHSNAPGLRHSKRWQDVIELLDAGINVYTTLNVQHLESMNDLVERIAGVVVRETLPDSVVEQADEVELVDTSPDELLERFREGKIYRPDQAERAAKHFFNKGNLLALRELALRKTADRVDAQMTAFRRENAVRAVQPAAERVLVCVSPSPLSSRVVRSAKRLADSLRARWVAAYVETPGSARLSDVDRQRVDQTLVLAEQLGAEVVTLNGLSVADELVAFAGTHNITKFVIGKPLRSRLRDFVMGSVVDDLIRRSGQTDVYVIRGEEGADHDSLPRPSFRPKADWPGFAVGTVVVGLTTAIGWPLYHWLGVENSNILMLYLLAVLWVATHHTRWASVAASVLAVVAFDLVFVPPYYSFAISDRQYLITFSVMLLTALVISALTLRVRTQAEASRHRERRTGALLALTRELAAARSIEQIGAATVTHVVDVLGGRAMVFTAAEGDTLVPQADSSTTPLTMDERDVGVARWAMSHSQPAGAGTNTLSGADGTYLPLVGSRATVGVMCLMNDKTQGMRFERDSLALAFAAQAALAIERVQLVEEARLAWERVEAEFLRNTLLSGVSHELRTPLAAIKGAASAIMETPNIGDEDRASMLETICGESDRMERLITNLLDMTRMESGGLLLKREWQPPGEVIGAALQAMDRRLRGRAVHTAIPIDLPLINLDAVAIEQVLVNLLDNAVEYTPPESPIEVKARILAEHLVVEVIDHGPGVPSGTEKRVFEKFFRAQPAASRRGIGLGLAISQGIITAHGGQITASNAPGGGAVFAFTLPVGKAPQVREPVDAIGATEA